MPRTKKVETPQKSEPKTAKKTTVKKTDSKTVKKEEPKKSKSKEEFVFGGVNGRMSKEERLEIIEEALHPSKPKVDLSYKVDETEYVPKEWCVVLTPNGYLYQEPIPRYWDVKTFVDIMASIPDKATDTNKVDFESEVTYMAFEVKGVECYVVSASMDGTRKLNEYAKMFPTKTLQTGGNLVFCGMGKGLSKKECLKVTETIVKKMNGYEEVIK